MKRSRRELLLTVGAAVATVGVAERALAAAQRAAKPPGGGLSPTVGVSSREVLADSPPVDLPRLREWLAREGLDAVVVSRPVNVYYLTGFWPATSRMGYDDAVVALVTKDPQRPIAIVTGEFTWYYLMSDTAYRYPKEVFLYGAPPDPNREASAWQGKSPGSALSRVFPDAGLAAISERDRRRGGDVDRAVEAHGLQDGREQALLRALAWAGLKGGRVAADGDVARGASERGTLDIRFADAEPLLRRVRMVKSPREVALARAAATANVGAALAAVADVRAGATLDEFRRSYYSEAARRGNRGVFMVVDGVSAEGVTDRLREGQAFMFDAVSEGAGYHGDFSRTVFLGEPPRAAKPVVAAVQRGWQAVRGELRPGRRFSEITAIGRAATARAGLDLLVMFGPHSVGLLHNDAVGLGDLTLEPGMIVSVDCPVLNSGVGGTFHFEDLMLITRDAAEPLHPVAPAVLQA